MWRYHGSGRLGVLVIHAHGAVPPSRRRGVATTSEREVSVRQGVSAHAATWDQHPEPRVFAPTLPGPALGQPATASFGNVHRGTTTPFTALQVGTGKVSPRLAPSGTATRGFRPSAIRWSGPVRAASRPSWWTSWPPTRSGRSGPGRDASPPNDAGGDPCKPRRPPARG